MRRFQSLLLLTCAAAVSHLAFSSADGAVTKENADKSIPDEGTWWRRKERRTLLCCVFGVVTSPRRRRPWERCHIISVFLRSFCRHPVCRSARRPVRKCHQNLGYGSVKAISGTLSVTSKAESLFGLTNVRRVVRRRQAMQPTFCFVNIHCAFAFSARIEKHLGNTV